MTILEKIRNKVLGIIGLARTDGKADADRLTFINNSDIIKKNRIEEFNVWYYGDSDELLNYYTHKNTIDYNFEPWYSRNKKDYFWTVSATELGIKRTHSGQPRNIIDTLVNITQFPIVHSEGTVLKEIIEESNIEGLYIEEQLPLTLVEGWGAYKINWDLNVSQYPYAVYYTANNVEFVEKSGRIMGVIFKDFYTDGKNRRYVVLETRRKEGHNLIIECEVFRANSDGEYIIPITEEECKKIPELSHIERGYKFEGYDGLLAVPCVLFKNTGRTGGPGRSIFTGKIDLFDDLDQCLSQGSNAVRRSTPVEYFDTDYLERDPKTGMPIQPKAYDRKYTLVNGQRDADGVTKGSEPVHVTQPNITFSQYSDEAIQIMVQIINGVMSPATLGIDIAKKDNAEAQREKEKVTIFTRNAIIRKEMKILKSLFNELLCAYDYISSDKGLVWTKYDVSIKFSEFADDSYENKLEKLGAAYDNELISDEMYMSKLYGDTLSEEEYEKELQWLKENHTKPRVEGEKGAAFGKFGGNQIDEEEELQL